MANNRDEAVNGLHQALPEVDVTLLATIVDAIIAAAREEQKSEHAQAVQKVMNEAKSNA